MFTLDFWDEIWGQNLKISHESFSIYLLNYYVIVGNHYGVDELQGCMSVGCVRHLIRWSQCSSVWNS